MTRMISDIKFGNLRTGDSLFSNSRKATGRVVRYAQAWGKGSKRAARKAARSKSYPSHGFNVLESWGQRYPAEATISGYKRTSFDEYRTERNRIVDAYRWDGFEDERVREKAAAVMELWCRRDNERKRVRYDLSGAVLSSPLGSWLFGWMFPRAHERANRLFCTEGMMNLHVICGVLGEEYEYDIPPKELEAIVVQAREDGKLPYTDMPYSVEQWMRRHHDFTHIPLGEIYTPIGAAA